MKFAKLVDGVPQYAPNPILVGEFYYGNPDDDVYIEAGYKPVTYSDMPSDAPEGQYYEEHWRQTARKIIQEWKLVEEG